MVETKRKTKGEQKQGWASSMKNASCFLVLALVCSAGCSAARGVCGELREAQHGLAMERCEARRAWLKGEEGRGIALEVWVSRGASEYERDLRLELQGAARVCEALSASDAVLRWDYVDLHFFNRYRFAGSRNIVGAARVIVRREALARLRAEGAPISEYARYWRFASGYKDQPDSRELLSW